MSVQLHPDIETLDKESLCYSIYAQLYHNFFNAQQKKDDEHPYGIEEGDETSLRLKNTAYGFASAIAGAVTGEGGSGSGGLLLDYLKKSGGDMTGKLSANYGFEAAKEDGDDKLAEKIAGGSFGGGLKYSYGHCLYVFDLGERAKGVQMMTLSHAQFKDLDERKFKLWSKKLAKNPSYPCPISSVYDAYPVEIEKRKNGAKTEYVISIDNESEPVPLTKEELTALMGAPRIPEIIYRYTRYHLGATVEFLKQCDGIYGMSLMETDEMKTVIDTLDGELPKEDISAFSFDRRTKDNRENGREGGGISLDDLFERYDELQRQELGEKTEEGQELRAMIRGYIEQEGLSVRVTRSTSNRELLDLIESEMEGPKPSDEPEDVPGEEEEQPEETEERAGRPRHRR